MLGKATGEFRKMTNDFRFALEDEVRDLERQTRIREEEKAAAARAAQAPSPSPAAAPEGAVPREVPGTGDSPAGEGQPETLNSSSTSPDSGSESSHAPAETVSVPHEKSSDDNSAV
jgi:hypothetical protein